MDSILSRRENIRVLQGCSINRLINLSLKISNRINRMPERLKASTNEKRRRNTAFNLFYGEANSGVVGS
jgi:hypothetical protein